MREVEVLGSDTPDHSPLPPTDSALVSQARARLAALPLEALRDAGIFRDRSYFLNISYPSMQTMPEVAAEQVLPELVEEGEEGNDEPTADGSKSAVYIHVPFCTAECYYCHYYKKFREGSDAVEQYMDSALQELSMQAERRGGIEAASLYFGGGTPSYLTPDQMDRFLTGVKGLISVPEGIEFSYEVHPESSDEERLSVLRSHGVNRVNIGVESFNDRVLDRENRRHTAREAIEAYERARSVGFGIINLDLIYGLRGQSVAEWEENLQVLGDLQPDSATLYFLRLKRGTPEYQLWRKDPGSFPTDDELLLMHAMNFEYMEGQLGYTQNPADWFIKDPKFFHQYQDHNWRRSDETELLGIGPSAYSYVGGWQYYNVNDTARYQESVREGKFPVWRGEHLQGDEPLRRTIMLGIKMGIDRRIFEKTYGVDAVGQFREDWERLVSLGLITINSDMISLTYTGKLFADEVGQQFYSDEMKRRMASVDPELISTTWPQFNP
ncbi:MAG: hypothetical protein ACD_37C00659G0005 [uncultured bacterium]|nr:MAG: hypothetical protein ACD_37C00659G0005 [uncultured bacterium]